MILRTGKVPKLASLICTLTAMLCVTAVSQAQIINGNFENGYTSGWNHDDGSDDNSSAVFSEEKAHPYEGSKALKVVVSNPGTNPWDVQTLGPSLSLTVEEEYTLTFWAKASEADTSIRTVLQNNLYQAEDHSLETTWREYSWTFTAKETSPQFKIFYLQAGTVWLDDIRYINSNEIGPIQIDITPQMQYQEMVGFGGALSWYTNWIYGGSDENDAAIEQWMFEDLGIDVLRLKNWYYPVNYPESTSPSNVEQKEAFDNTKDLFNAAKTANPDVQVLLSSWSPPASLKSNGIRKDGGTLKQDSDGFMYDDLAQYWVDSLDNLGWTPDYLSFQNEPGYTATWESCILRPTETEDNAGYAEAADAIWYAIKDRPNVPKMLGSEAENIGTSTWSDWNDGNPVNTFEALNTPLRDRPYIHVHGYHTYDIGDPSKIDSDSTIENLNRVRDFDADRPNWMTEWSKNSFDWLQTARMVHNTVVEANASAYIFWKLAWNSDESNDTMIAVQLDGSYEIRPHYYTIKHYSKHVDMGDKRIEVISGDSNVKASGYLSEDATRITLVAINKATSDKNIELDLSPLTVSSVTGYQSVSGSFYQDMNGLDPNSEIPLPAESMTTLVLTLTEPYISPTNGPPFWIEPEFSQSDATVGEVYQGSIASNANDPEGDDLQFSLDNGPAWLSIDTSGEISGTPSISNVDTNIFTVSISDDTNPAVQTTMTIEVLYSSTIDSDGDGINDAEEASNGSNPLDPRDPWVDADGDWVHTVDDNGDSNPRSPFAMPLQLSLTRQTDSWTLSAPVSPGVTTKVEYVPTLNSDWTVIHTFDPVATPSIADFELPATYMSPNQQKGFFRLNKSTP